MPQRGSVLLGPRGVTLQSTTGDFCEWHARADGEAPFEEGDLVGFNKEGMLTRNTTGVGPPQHGLPSRKMALITSDCGATRSLGIEWPE